VGAVAVESETKADERGVDLINANSIQKIKIEKQGLVIQELKVEITLEG
jgi:hypothetical protein